jgi:hypothetical protein
MKEASPEDIEKMSVALRPSPDRESAGLSMDDLRRIVEQPMEPLLTSEVSTVTPILAGMRQFIIQTADSPGFVTSDAPCVWLDPELYKESPAFGAGGLISSSIEILMPLSPRQCVYFGHQLVASGFYLSLKSHDPLLDHVNRRVCQFADEHVVATEDVRQQPWFTGDWC